MPTKKTNDDTIDPRRMFYGGNEHGHAPKTKQSLRNGGKKPNNKRKTMKKKKPMKKNEGYCLKCKKYRIINNAKEDTIKNGRPVLKGECIVCGTKMMKFI